MFRPLLRSLRPAQWVKNLFVIAPLLFSRKLMAPEAALRSLVAFVAFCFLCGGVYLLNDLSDRARDQLHPTKRFRPIASGELPVRVARLALVCVWAVALLLSLFLGWWFFLAALGYLFLNLLYSSVLRSVPLVDVGVIALGFLLRVIAGGAAIEVPLSPWIILNTFLLAFFMGLGKRLHELRTVGRSGGRASLRFYSESSLRLLLYLTGLVTSLAYLIYTLMPQTHLVYGTSLTFLTAPFPAMGILRFLALCEHSPKSPTEAILKDPPFLGIVGAWVVVVIWIVL